MTEATMIHLTATSNHALAHVVVTVIEHEIVLHVRNGTTTARVVVTPDEAHHLAHQLLRQSLEADGLVVGSARGPRRRH